MSTRRCGVVADRTDRTHSELFLRANAAQPPALIMRSPIWHISTLFDISMLGVEAAEVLLGESTPSAPRDLVDATELGSYYSLQGSDHMQHQYKECRDAFIALVLNNGGRWSLLWRERSSITRR